MISGDRSNLLHLNLDRYKWAILIPLVLGFAIFAVYALWFSPAAVQRRNMSLAVEHNLALRRLIAGDGRFERITFGEWTGDGGGGSVTGLVRDRAEAEALEKIVRDSRPPTLFCWGVELDEDPDDEYRAVKPRAIWPVDAARPSVP